MQAYGKFRLYNFHFQGNVSCHLKTVGKGFSEQVPGNMTYIWKILKVYPLILKDHEKQAGRIINKIIGNIILTD